MIAKLTRKAALVAVAALAFSSCSFLGKDYGMASEEGIAKIKELIAANVKLDECKIYRLEWKEDDNDRKLENILTQININYIDKSNDEYVINITNVKGDFVATEPDCMSDDKYSYEMTKGIDLNTITYDYIQKLTDDALEVFKQEEDSEIYELKSAEEYRFYVSPVSITTSPDKRNADWFKKSHETIDVSFALNFINKEENPEVKGRHIWTNYYSIPFTVDENGAVIYDEDAI